MSGVVQAFLMVVCTSYVFTTLLGRVRWLRIPTAASYLVFGVILQIGVMPLKHDAAVWMAHLGDIGLLFLMFLSGLEVDVAVLSPSRSHSSRGAASGINALSLASSIFFTTLITSFAISWGIAHFIDPEIHPWMLTLLLATTSLGVILPVMEESRTLHSQYGQLLLLSAFLADVVTMLLISVFISARTSGHYLDMLISLCVLPVAVLTFILFRWLRKSPYLRTFAGDVQQRIRAIIALVAAFCALADFTGSEPIVGSFLVGLVVSALPFAFKDTLKHYCHGLGYGFLIPIFFISVGMTFNLQVFNQPSAWLWVPLLLAAAYIVKIVPALQLRPHFGTRKAVAGGMLLSSRLSLIVAAAEIGVRIGALPLLLSEAVVIVAVLTCLISPISFVYLL